MRVSGDRCTQASIYSLSRLALYGLHIFPNGCSIVHRKHCLVKDMNKKDRIRKVKESKKRK